MIAHCDASPARFARLAAAAALFFSLLSAAPHPAHASQGDAEVRVSLMGANAGRVSNQGPQLGFGGQAGVGFDISDFWSIDFGAEALYHPSAKPGDKPLESMVVQDVFAGFRYNLDIFVYVPYVGLSAVAYGLTPRTQRAEAQRPGVGAKLTVGLDWRFQRHWSLGAMAELHALELQFSNFPGYASIGLNLSYHFRL